MIRMQRHVTAGCPPEAAFAYLADFTTTEQWDPGTVRTERVSGDGGAGTRYANTSRFAGRTSDLSYVVTALTPGERIELRGENASVVAHDTVTVAAQPDGCLVTYQVAFAFKGWLRWFEPLLRIAVANLLDKGAQGLDRELARLHAGG
ncbi:polyketide cyclase [Mycobacterium sp. 852013-50091_SCH5140682]|nr:SRPBCC family protein [Mycobacterium sp. 852013-50091_SCH5140682]OBC04189.1 polyketide cyclase [Mycobacterium sp. 852013-50091_SCH5140682]